MDRDRPVSYGRQTAMLAIAWLFVGIPLAWGIITSALNALQLFR